jgi:hypothetical protein
VVVPDANILLYAYNLDATQHRLSAAWLEEQFNSREQIGLTWLTLWAFVRIGSRPRVFPNPLAVTQILEIIEAWLSRPNVVLIEPGPRHLTILKSLITGNDVAGNLTTDAALAAIAIEHAATLASTDRDFRRFSGLRWINPLEDQA